MEDDLDGGAGSLSDQWDSSNFHLVAEALDSVFLSWSGVSTICRESHNFEERMFDKIASPLLKDG